jgi:hypothetical protein
VIEECCTQNQEKYKKDKGFLRIWLILADLSEKPTEILEYMYKMQIGTNFGLFYIAWATILETNEEMDDAYLVLKNGKKAETEPTNQLVEYFDSFLIKYETFKKKSGQPVVAVENKSAPPKSGNSSAGYHKHLIYPNEKEEYSFEELRASMTRYQWIATSSSLDEDSIEDELDFDLSDDELFVSSRFSISNKKEEQMKPQRKFRASLANVFHQPQSKKKEITIHTKDAEKDVLDMFGGNLEEEDNMFQKKKKRKEDENELDLPKKKKKKIEIYDQEENASPVVPVVSVPVEKKSQKMKLEIFEDSENLIQESPRPRQRDVPISQPSEQQFNIKTEKYLKLKKEFNLERIVLEEDDEDEEERIEIISKKNDHELTIKMNQRLFQLKIEKKDEVKRECQLINEIKKCKGEHKFGDYLRIVEYQNQVIVKLDKKEDTLSDYLDCYKKMNKVMDEHLIMFYTIELLTILETLHGECRLTHGSFMKENLVLMFEQDENEEWKNWNRNLQGGWKNKGLKLIHFENASNSMNNKEKEKDLKELANIVHFMLFGKEMKGEIEMMKKFWQLDLWNSFFDSIQRPECDIKSLREMFEDYFEKNPKKSISLKQLLCKQFNMFQSCQ